MKPKMSILLTDSPDVEKDSFQIHTNIVENLFGIVTNLDVHKTSFTIGLFGEWGTGKTFIINKLLTLQRYLINNLC